MTKQEQQRRLRLLRQQQARRRDNLLSPTWGEGERARCFPKWTPSMSTAEYITRFQNSNQTNRSFDGRVGRLAFTHAPGVPTMNQPEEN